MPLYLGPSRAFTDYMPRYDADTMLINGIRGGNNVANSNVNGNSQGWSFSSFNYSNFVDKYADEIIKYNLKQSIRKSNQPRNYPRVKFYQPCSM